MKAFGMTKTPTEIFGALTCLALVLSACSEPFTAASSDQDSGARAVTQGEPDPEPDAGSNSDSESSTETANDDTAATATTPGVAAADAGSDGSLPGSCAKDEYEGPNGCTSLTVCGKDEFEKTAPTATTDRVCKKATICGDDSYVSAELTKTSDRVCSALSVCARGEYESSAATKDSDRECSTYTKCGKDEYESVLPTKTSDRKCQTLTTCADDEFELTPATRTSDRKCQTLTTCTQDEYESVAPTKTSDRKCTLASVCADDEFETTAPSTTSDRTCQTLTVCSDTEYESAAPTATSDRQCEAISDCALDTYETAAPTATSNRQCAALSVCGATQFETAAPTATTDRQCSDLSVCGADQYESTSPTPTSDRQCSDVSVCTPNQYQSGAPGPSQDRQCAALTQCTAQQFESVTPTPTSDRQCLLALWQFGGSAQDVPFGTAFDLDGNLFVAGYTTGDLDGTGSGKSAGGRDAFVAKLSRDGSIIWQKQFGTTGDDTAFSVAADHAGNAIVTGATTGDLDGVGSGQHQGANDAFVAKFDAAGKRTWVRQFGTAENEAAYFVAVNSQDESAVTGYTLGDIDGNGPEDALGSEDGFVTTFSADGTRGWTRQWGTSDTDMGITIAIDTDDNVSVVGTTVADLDADGPDELVGGADIAVLEWDAEGTLRWQHQLGSSDDEYEPYVAADPDGNVLVGFSTTGDVDADGPGEFVGQTDAIVAKFTIDGDLDWVTQLGTDNVDYVTGAASDAQGNVFIVGYTLSDLDGAGGDAPLGDEDVLLVKLDPTGDPLWTRQFGTTASDSAGALVVDVGGGVTVVGTTGGDFDGAGPGDSFGNDDVFVAGFNAAGNL